MSTSFNLSTGVLGAGLPLKPTFGASSCKGSVRHKPCAKTAGSLRLVKCSLEPLQGSGVGNRSKERYQVCAVAPCSASLLLDGLSMLQDSVPQKVTRPPTKSRVILIAGPTAVGKTKLSIELAKELGGEIINADSVQVYQGLDIGAAKATMEERQGVPHHLMDMVLPTIEYSYARFVADARAATADILSRGRVPIVIGGTGMYMRTYMHNTANITSHPFPGEGGADPDQWDFDFQAYFLYQHRADLFPRLDLRCEVQIPELLKETSRLLDLGALHHLAPQARDAIGYEESIGLLLDARRNGGVVSEQRFLKFLALFQHNCRDLARKQTAWWRKSARSDVRQFRWIQAGLPVEQMVEVLAGEYAMPVGLPFDVESGKELVALSLKEQKRMQTYRPALHIYHDADAVASVLKWIKRTQGLPVMEKWDAIEDWGFFGALTGCDCSD